MVIKLKKSQSFCLLIAHPDDEVLFFGPTIISLMKLGHKLHVLCLSNGNFYGLGLTREGELINSCKRLDKNIKVKIEPKFEDHPSQEWHLDDVESIVTSYLKDNKIDSLITFDEYGVSSHVNHCSLNKAITRLKRNNENLKVYTLKTCFVLRKYSFFFDLLPTLVYDLRFNFKNRKNLLFVSTPRDYLVNIKAMLEHKPQLLWFRYLYIISSRYILINYLVLFE